MMDEAAVIKQVLHSLNQIKIYHWSTMSFAKHKALDDLHGALSDKVDHLVECYIGRFKKQPLKTFHIEVSLNSDGSKLDKFLEEQRNSYDSLAKLMKAAPELQNIIEEIIAEFDKAAYLCKLQ